MVATPTTAQPVLAEDDWRHRRAAHQRRVDGWITPHRERQRRGESHPVEDFLFTYYSYRPARLRRWHPGAGVRLAAADPVTAAGELGTGYHAVDSAVTLDAAPLIARRRSLLDLVHTLLSATTGRPGQYGCFGLHEWAMVYRLSANEVRHAAIPLRLSPAAVARVVDERGVRCTHFDAFRFFTSAARPLNVVQPSRETQTAHEQPGCLHANMDLYKWAYKLSPLIPSELVADCFALAYDIRVLDMRASPYDLAELGYPPVPIETPEGRAGYAAAQRGFAERAEPLRARLIAESARLRAEGARPPAAVRRLPGLDAART